MKITKTGTDKFQIYSIFKPIRLILLASILVFATACDEEDDDKGLRQDVFKATLSGANEIPPNASTATGTATLTFNRDSKIFTVIVEYSGLTVTSAQVMKGTPDVAGDVVATFAVTESSPMGLSTEPITKQQEDDLYAGLYYVNLYSALYPAGEIRGQLIKQ